MIIKIGKVEGGFTFEVIEPEEFKKWLDDYFLAFLGYVPVEELVYKNTKALGGAVGQLVMDFLGEHYIEDGAFAPKLDP